jgi:hypothetical protein
MTKGFLCAINLYSPSVGKRGSNRFPMIEYKTRPKIHPSHELTEWKTKVLRFTGKPMLFPVRKCEYCGAIQAERDDVNFIYSELKGKCGKKASRPYTASRSTPQMAELEFVLRSK